MAPEVTPDALFGLRVGEAAALLGLLCLSPLIKAPPPPDANGHSPIVSVVRAVKVPRRQLIISLLTLAAFTAFLDGTVTVANAIFRHVVETTQAPWRGIEYYAVALLVAHAGFALVGSYKDTHGASVWQSPILKTFVFVGLVCDIAMAVLIPLIVPIWEIHEGVKIPELPDRGYAPAVHFGVTVLRALVLTVLFGVLLFPRTAYESAQSQAPQTAETSLLIPSAATTSAGLAAPKAKYGTFQSGPSSGPPSRAQTPAPSIGGPSTSAAGADKPPRTEPLTWSETGSRLRRLLPYLWPSKSFGLQLLAILSLLIVALGRAVAAAVPFSLVWIVNTLNQGGNVVVPVITYVVLRFLQGNGGLAALRDILWAPVMQYSDRSMSQLTFDHLLNLSLAWHIRRKTGEVLRILDRGAAINHIFELLLFNIIPTIADIGIALWVFFWFFGPVLSIVIAAVMVTYIALSITLTTWRTKIRREMNEADITTRGIHTDCLLNYETVKYFGGEQHEGDRYRDAIVKYQSKEFRVMASLNVLNLTQNFIISVGLLVGSLMVALDRTRSPEDTVARFVLFITYVAQLYQPLNSLGYVYRSINQNLVDTEKLIQLLDEPSEVKDKPDAKELVVTDGVIEFDNVTFSYDGRTTALNGVSFTIPKGGSLALVGESGSGKSTILRLLYRFYDLAPGNGAIRIDGQDIRDVTQASLRKAIGVVPQDSVLFNNTIAYNIGYGKFDATPEEIENAARAAQLHERIMSFPDGYETKVGERGVRLSGGEKQRVAIARTILKAPRIILLDEATSALDTTTERDIQKAFQNLVDGRSSLSIAHRLSTIANSDVILVLHGGEIVESGSHRELVERDGRFAAMWADQISSADDTRSVRDQPHDDDAEVPGYAVDAPEHSHDNEVHILPVPPVDTPDNFIPTNDGAVGLGPGPVTVPVDQLPPAETSEDLAAKQLALNSEVRPDVSFADAVAGTKTEEPEQVKADEEAPKTEEAPAAAAPLEFPQADSPPPVSFPKADDEASVAGSARPALKETTSGGSTPGVTFAPGVDGERIKAVAQRWRKVSQGAAAKSGQGLARLARRMSQGPSRHSSEQSVPTEGNAAVVVPADELPAADTSVEVAAKQEALDTENGAAKPEDAEATGEAPKADDAAPVSFPAGEDDASVSGSTRPPLKEATSGGSNPGVTFAPGVDGERIKAVAQRWRKVSQGAAAKSGQGLARLARRISSQTPSRQPSGSSSVPGSPGFTGSARASMDVESGSVAESDKKKDKRKSSDN
ncbi:ABC transporter [Ceratobasidium sp. AG-Ba]|nr:ABC transporter [Ceratobasidium sp. AG-Ba]